MTQRGKYHDSPVQNLHDYRLHSGVNVVCPTPGHRINVTSVYAIQIRYGSRGNICAYQFRLDNGGNDEGFGPLTITLQLKDKYGQTLVTRKNGNGRFLVTVMPREPQTHFWKRSAWKMSPQPKIIKATEESNGHRVSLPLSVSIPRTTITADYRFRKNVN